MLDPQLVAQARKANLEVYFRNQGYELLPVKSRRGVQYKIPDFGGLYVRDHMFYQFSTERSGNAVECLMEVFGFPFKKAVEELLCIPTATPSSSTLNVSFTTSVEMPDRSANVKRIYAYLISKRGLDREILSLLIQNKLIYQDVRGNAVFVHYDSEGNAIGGELQGTTDIRFKGIVPGTHLSAFEIKNGKPNRVYLFESSIDLLSYLQLNRYDPNDRNVLYASMAGLKKELVLNYLDRGLDVVSFVDHDAAGIVFNKSLRIELDFPLAELIVPKGLSYVCGKLDDRYIFSTEEDLHYFKKRLNLSDEVITRSMILDAHAHFSVDNRLREEGVKDWNELLLKK